VIFTRLLYVLVALVGRVPLALLIVQIPPRRAVHVKPGEAIRTRPQEYEVRVIRFFDGAFLGAG
jgi:hypothetical protein